MKKEIKITLTENDIHTAYNKLLVKYAALEKENAELKEDNKVMADNYSKMEQKFYDNLTKAKELLNEFLDFESSCMERGIYISDKTRAEAEHFLNSEVEK